MCVWNAYAAGLSPAGRHLEDSRREELICIMRILFLRSLLFDDILPAAFFVVVGVLFSFLCVVAVALPRSRLHFYAAKGLSYIGDCVVGRCLRGLGMRTSSERRRKRWG